ncbi:MAG: hypothetical protein A2731_02110 [Candidatus Buchananbacteria bacterium RIFCSPHIGHO2_01_FULL_39_8]|uniref:Type II secretion system protein GspG C-terminal domain-containing protein n=1 Tax=Candidatus Buchananbacteria bacterium RIFCSPHIGHO2_01_FULL_39_8 TaxID=1797533 RepID=A0A1G1Y1N6_9BACT|nr:MAG: hypothetical protein A2731_02110 [Candidatus Buchananbacteria bacterium RIFCSPHIGHO2_01_FULL_39_8]
MKFSLKSKGFTLIELLVVISIVGLLSTLGLVALGSARAKARDVKRVADLKQVQKALEMFYNEPGLIGYPTPSPVTLGLDATCLSSEGLKPTSCGGSIYMGLLPIDPSASASEICDGTNDQPCNYTYTRTGTDGFEINFYLERGIENLTPDGNKCLKASGFINSRCPCGDGACVSGETCSTCFTDCGVCP